MESKRVSSRPTLPRREARTDAIKRATVQRVLVVDPTKPSIIRVTAATLPRIITTQPAIKPSPMPIALEEEDDLRPTHEILGSTASTNPTTRSSVDDASRSSHRRAATAVRAVPVPGTVVAPSRDDASRGERASGVSSASAVARAQRAIDRAPEPHGWKLGVSLVAGVLCVALTVIALEHAHLVSIGAPTTGATSSVRVPPPPRAIPSPRVDTVRTEAPAAATAPEPAREPRSGPSPTPTPTPPRETTERSSRVARFAAAPTPVASGRAACLRRCRGNADCVIRCIDGGARIAPTDVRVDATVRDAPTPEEVRLALARLGGEVSDCSNGTLTGLATVDVTFANSGQVNNAVVRTPFAGTPIGSCIARVVRAARVPTFNRRLLHVAYSYRVH